MGQIVFQATLGGQTALVGQNTASSYSLTLPLATDTLVGKATTDTLTNKTLTSPTINGATLTTSAFNGTIGATTPSTAVVTSLTDSGLTSGRVTYATTGGLLTDSANMTFNGTTLTLANDASISGLTVGKGGGAVGTNAALGTNALFNNTSGSYNTGAGYNALYVTTTGYYNSAFGGGSLAANTTGLSNTGVGAFALTGNTTGGSNTALGVQSLNSNTTASNNTAVGYQAGYNNTTSQNNVLIGTKAGYSLTSASGGNVIIGYQAGYNSTGYGNTFIGGGVPASVDGAGTAMTTGNKNTIIGNYTGNQGGLDIRTASNYIVLSDGDGNPLAYVQNAVNNWYQKSNSTLWSITSDARIKKNVVSLETGLDVISALRPVEFDYIENDKHDIGFIAQEYQTVLPAQITEKENGMLSLNQNLVPYLVKAIQELKAEIDLLKAK